MEIRHVRSILADLGPQLSALTLALPIRSPARTTTGTSVGAPAGIPMKTLMVTLTVTLQLWHIDTNHASSPSVNSKLAGPRMGNHFLSFTSHVRLPRVQVKPQPCSWLRITIPSGIGRGRYMTVTRDCGSGGVDVAFVYHGLSHSYCNVDFLPRENICSNTRSEERPAEL